MEKYKVIGQRATSLVLSLSMLASFVGCAKQEEQEKETNDLATEVIDVAKEQTAKILDKNNIYDEAGVFSLPLSYYEFSFFPKTNRTDIDLTTVLDAYGISYEDYVNIFVRVIYACHGANNYEEAYAITTVILNRLLYQHSLYGSNLIDIVTKVGQFDAYMSKDYIDFEIEDLESYEGWQAILDCLINFAEDPTNRMHNFMSFLYPECVSIIYPKYDDTPVIRYKHSFILNGNMYDFELTEDKIEYKDITLSDSRTRTLK